MSDRHQVVIVGAGQAGLATSHELAKHGVSGIAAPEMPGPAPLGTKPPEEVDLSGFGAVIFAVGFRPDYASWVHIPGAFDDLGFPLHSEGASTAAAGLYFVGVHFLRTRKSATFFGVGGRRADRRRGDRRQLSVTANDGEPRAWSFGFSPM